MIPVQTVREGLQWSNNNPSLPFCSDHNSIEDGQCDYAGGDEQQDLGIAAAVREVFHDGRHVGRDESRFFFRCRRRRRGKLQIYVREMESGVWTK